MPNDEIDIAFTLEGENIAPETVRVSTILRILGEFEQAIEAAAEESGTEFDQHEALLVPERFEHSSYRMRGRVMPRAATPVVQIGTALRAKTTEKLNPRTRDRLRDIQRELGNREASLRVETTDENASEFSMTQYAPVIAPGDESPETRTSHSVVYGVCLRINRNRRDATVRLHDDSKTKLTGLDDNQIQRLMKAAGEDLDQVFRIEGTATWQIDDYTIDSIAPSSIQTVNTDSGELFDELRRATDNQFDDTHTEDFMRKLR